MLSFSYPSLGQSASFQQLQPSTLADTSSVSQPVDSLGLARNQLIDLATMPATTLNPPVDAFGQIANDLGMPVETLMPCRAVDVGQLPLAGDMESIVEIAPNGEYVLNRQGSFVAEDRLQQNSAFQYAAACTSVGLITAGDGTARDPRKREEPDRQVHFRSASPLPLENRFRPGTHEYPNAREQRVRVFAMREAKRDSAGSGQLERDMVSSGAESRPVGLGPGKGQGTSSMASGSHTAVQQQAISNSSSNAPLPPPANEFNANPAMGLGGTQVVTATVRPPGTGQGIGRPPRVGG